MNLLERCQSANAKITQLVEAKKSKEIADNIRKRTSDLGDASESLVDYSNRATVLLDAGILKPTELADDSKLAHQLTEMRQKLNEDPSAITSGNPSPVNKWKKTVVKHAEATTKTVNTAWNEYVTQITPEINGKLLKQYRSTPYANTVSKLEKANKESKRLAKAPPADAESLAELKACWDEVRSDLASLPVTDDPDVRAFLTAVGSETGAGIESLTPTVLKWLQDNGMVDQFSIRKTR